MPARLPASNVLEIAGRRSTTYSTAVRDDGRGDGGQPRGSQGDM